MTDTLTRPDPSLAPPPAEAAASSKGPGPGPGVGQGQGAGTATPTGGRVDLGVWARRPEPRRFSTTEAVAVALSVVWIVAVGAFFLLTGGVASDGGALTAVMTLLAIFLPLAMIWVTAVTARTVQDLRDEAARLQAAVDGMRTAYVQQSQAAALGIRPAMERKLDEIAAAQRHTETQLATFTSRRDHARVVPSADRKAALPIVPANPADEQPALALGTPADEMRPPIPVRDFLRALNFPESVEDKEGFRALRAALENREMARLIRAAQDVLTLLSQDGIYMDDLKPDRARTEIWRRFAQGARGPAIAGLGGVRDRSSLALTAGRMRSDPVFRDAAHHFLRQFDKTLTEFEKTATDPEMAELAETRTARAFMLFGRVTGTFD